MSSSVTPCTEPDSGLVDRVRWRLARTGDEPTADRVASALRAEGGVHSDRDVLAVVTALGRELVGAGPLAPLLADPEVTDVLVNGAGGVWVDRGRGLEPVSTRVGDGEAVERLARRLAAAAGRRLDTAAPYVDARLPGGVRLHAVLPPVAPDGAHLSLRVPPRRAFTMEELVRCGTLAPDIAATLRAIVAGRLAFLVSGGTGAGKTTVLATLLGLVPPAERIVLVEDSSELRPEHPHVVRLESRPPNLEGAGAVTMRDLVRQALRMRPDRLVVGEVRGGEVIDLLAALNTGHDGGCGTLHANSAADVPARVEALALAAGLDRAATHSQLASGVDVVVHLARGPDRVRRLAEVAVPRRGADGLVSVVPAVSFGDDGRLREGAGAVQLAGALER